MNRRDAVEFLLKRPVDFARMIGFNKLTELHNEWITDMVYGTGDSTLQAHRGSYKTTCLSIAIPIIMLLFPNDRILFTRKTDNDIKEVIAQIAKIISTPHYGTIAKTIYGRNISMIVQKHNELTIDTVRDLRGSSQLIGMGTGGSLTGKHFDRIFTDDIINVDDRTYHSERERTKIVYQELQNLRNPGGRIFNSGTPWHIEDAFTLMPEPKRFDCYTTKLLSEPKIEELRKHMSPSLFAANYELRHIASEDALFTQYPQFTDNESLIRDGIAHIDAAYNGSDYTAFTCGKRVGDTIYLYGKMWRKHVDTVLDRIIADANKLKCAPIYTEQNSDKGYLGREIRNRNGYAYVYTEHQNKFIKISNYLHKWWGNIVFLKGTDQEYISQILNYTDAAEHDDAPDSAACVVRILDRG